MEIGLKEQNTKSINHYGSRYKGVLYDCDGVLVESEILSAKVLKDYLFTYGVDKDVEFCFDKLQGRKVSSWIAELLSEEALEIDRQQFEIEYRKKVNDQYTESLTPVKGIDKVLIETTTNRAVVSNAPLWKIKKGLDITGLCKHFKEPPISAYEEHTWKPDKRLYEVGARRLKLDPTECIAIEDSEAGAISALDAGCFVIVLNARQVYEKMNPFVKKRVHFVAPSHESVLNVVKELTNED